MMNGKAATAEVSRRAPPPRRSTNDEAMLLLQDRQRAAIDLNFLLQRAMNDTKIATTYQAFRVRYLRALGKFRPAEYDDEEETEEDILGDQDGQKAAETREALQKLRQREREKKEHCSQLQSAWLLYDTLATDKPEMLNAEEEQLEKDMDDFERDLFEEWHDFAEDVIARAEFENDNSKDIMDWHLELKEIRKDLKHIARRCEEKADTRKRALRRIKQMVRARRGSDVSQYDEDEEEDDEDEDEEFADDDEEVEVEEALEEDDKGSEDSKGSNDDQGSDDDQSKKSSKSSRSSKSSKKKKHKKGKSVDILAEVSEHGGDNQEDQLSKKSSTHSLKSRDKMVDKLSRSSTHSRRSKKDKKASKKKKEKQKRRNSMRDKLLEEVFPPHIAKALRDGRKVEPESKECVTIFFSDIVGFTNISSSISPLKVCDMLDRMYQKFDALSMEHDVFKVETIGDSWMGVTNLVKVRTAREELSQASFISQMPFSQMLSTTNETESKRPCEACCTLCIGCS